MNHRFASTLLCLAALTASPLCLAQYKVIDANGRVTYTDRPNTAAAAKVEPLRATGGTAAATSNLPFELRQIAERYPVTLYTSETCDPCNLGRSLLRQRGIPFTEKSVRTEADRIAFQQAESTGDLPVLRIGVQQLRGYAEAEWSSYLDAAGYPRQSKLPPSYKQAEATPVAGDKPARAKAPPAEAPPQPPATLPPALETAPNGIRF